MRPIQVKQHDAKLDSLDVTQKSALVETHAANRSSAQNHFLLDSVIPRELRQNTLSYLSFSEIAAYAYEVVEQPQDQLTHELMSREFNQRKAADYALLVTELKRPVNKDTILEMIEKGEVDFSFIERAIIHLSYMSPKDASYVFSRYFQCYEANWLFLADMGFNYISNRHVVPKYPAKNVAIAFLRFFHDLEINQHSRTVVFIEGYLGLGWGEASEPDCIVNVHHWSPLLEAILLDDEMIYRMIVTRYPKHIPNILRGLTELQNISVWYPNECLFKFAHVTAVKINLLLHLELKHEPFYSLNFDDKRLIENYLIQQIKNMKDKFSLNAFYQQHMNKLYLNQHRHGKFDNMRRHNFPQIKVRVLKELQNKYLELKGDDCKLTGNEKEQLARQVAVLKSILEAKYKQLSKKNPGIAFSLFYSDSKVIAKLNAINEALIKLNAITSITELRIFTEILLTNDALMDRCSIGFSASETYENLMKFYRAVFLAPGGAVVAAACASPLPAPAPAAGAAAPMNA